MRRCYGRGKNLPSERSVAPKQSSSIALFGFRTLPFHTPSHSIVVFLLFDMRYQHFIQSWFYFLY